MATRNLFEDLNEDLLTKIFTNILAPGDAVASGASSLAAIRLTCKEWATAGLHHVRMLRVRDATEVRHVRRILEHADRNLLGALDARISERNEGAPAILQELGRHAWERMRLGGAARNARIWESSMQTLTKLSTNNWGEAFTTEAQEEAWKKARESGDSSYFESIAGFPMLDASLVNCTGLREVELALDPSNLNEHLRFVPRRLWRLKAVQVLIVKPGRAGPDGVAPSRNNCPPHHMDYNFGLFLLSVAFPRVNHLKIPTWRFPLGYRARLKPSMDITGWRGVQTLELGTKGLPYTWMARNFVQGIVSALHPFNWPDLQTLIIQGIKRKSTVPSPFRTTYVMLVEPERRFLRDLRTLIIEHPVAKMGDLTARETTSIGAMWESHFNEEILREDEEEWRTFLDLPKVRAEGWVGQREDVSDGATSRVTLSRDTGALERSKGEEAHRSVTVYDREDAESRT